MEKVNKLIPFNKRDIFIYFFIYKTIIEIVYVFCISPQYSYSGLTFTPNNLSYWYSNVFLVILAMITPKDKERPSTYLFILMEVFLVIPTLSYCWMKNESNLYVAMVVTCIFIIGILIKIKPKYFKVNNRIAGISLKIIFIMYILMTIYLVVQRGGIDARAFNFDLIYELRSENELGSIAGYLVNWSTKALCPFFFVYFYYNKKNSLMVFVLVIQLMMYLSFGNKAFLFSIGILLMCTIIAKRKKFVKEFILVMSGLNIIAYIFDVFKITDSLRRAIPYRLIFIPTQIQFQYYDFFKEGEKLHFAEGIFGKIFSIQSPYPENASFIIGKYYSTNGLGTNANTGIFSDGYANGGFFSMIFISIVFAVILYLIDSVTYNIPNYIVIGSFSYSIFVLNDTSLLTALLTGGLLILIILLMLFNTSIGNELGKSKRYTISRRVT